MVTDRDIVCKDKPIVLANRDGAYVMLAHQPKRFGRGWLRWAPCDGTRRDDPGHPRVSAWSVSSVSATLVIRHPVICYPNALRAFRPTIVEAIGRPKLEQGRLGSCVVTTLKADLMGEYLKAASTNEIAPGG
jgi:hypothetical protein